LTLRRAATSVRGVSPMPRVELRQEDLVELVKGRVPPDFLEAVRLREPSANATSVPLVQFIHTEVYGALEDRFFEDLPPKTQQRLLAMLWALDNRDLGHGESEFVIPSSGETGSCICRVWTTESDATVADLPIVGIVPFTTPSIGIPKIDRTSVAATGDFGDLSPSIASIVRMLAEKLRRDREIRSSQLEPDDPGNRESDFSRSLRERVRVWEAVCLEIPWSIERNQLRTWFRRARDYVRTSLFGTDPFDPPNEGTLQGRVYAISRTPEEFKEGMFAQLCWEPYPSGVKRGRIEFISQHLTSGGPILRRLNY
jgi:hypothetical protein